MLLGQSLHSCSSSRFSTTYSKTPISTDSEIVCEMGVIVYEMGVIVYEIGVIVCEMVNATNRNFYISGFIIMIP